MEDNKAVQKKCIYCGRYFKPDYRAGERQKCCKDKACQAKRKKDSQRRWLEANPGYFKGRYRQIKELRKEYPDYQRRRRAKWRVKRCEIRNRQTRYPHQNRE